jgi:hypothetical protein
LTTNIKPNSIQLKADLERIDADLEIALADVALLERLKSAQDRVARLTAEQEKATKARDKALAAEAKAHQDARFAGLVDVQITDKTPEENVVRSLFVITYSRPTWDGRTSRVTQHERSSFGSLPPEVLDYIIEKRPELIPAKIMALAPDSPRDAFRRYFVSTRRGFVSQ